MLYFMRPLATSGNSCFMYICSHKLKLKSRSKGPGAGTDHQNAVNLFIYPDILTLENLIFIILIIYSTD